MLNRSLKFPAVYKSNAADISVVILGAIGEGTSLAFYGYTCSSLLVDKAVPQYQSPGLWKPNGDCVYTTAHNNAWIEVRSRRSIKFVPAGKKWYDALDADGQAILALFISQGMTADASPVVSYLGYKLNLQGPQIADTYNYAKGIK